MRKLVLVISCSLFVVSSIFTQAQEAVTAAGGDASGSGGTASYTIGQVVYTTMSNGGDTITQGVQQPYEIQSTTGITEAKGISLECAVYPNPTNDLIKLEIDASTMLSSQSISYQLYDINGKLLQNKKSEVGETIIPMADLMPAIYFLKVTDNTKVLKVFKIIKN